MVVFEVGGRDCALPVEAVGEVLPMATLARSPGQPPILEGFLNLRGEAVPVVRLDRLLGLEGKEPDLETALLVVRQGGMPVAFLVDRAAEITSIDSGVLMAVGQGNLLNDCVQAQALVEGRTVNVLSAGRLLLARERECLADLQAAAQRRLDSLEAATA